MRILFCDLRKHQNQSIGSDLLEAPFLGFNALFPLLCYIWFIWVSYLIRESWDLIWPEKRGSSWWPYALTCSSRWPDKQRCYPHYKNYSVNVSSKFKREGGQEGPSNEMKKVWTHNQGLLIHESWRVLGSTRLALLTWSDGVFVSLYFRKQHARLFEVILPLPKREKIKNHIGLRNFSHTPVMKTTT